MSAASMQIHQASPAKRDDPGDDSMQQFRARESKELIVGFIGPIGCGIPKIVNETAAVLQRAGYTIRRIKISAFLQQEIDAGRCHPKEYAGTGAAYSRYNKLQDAGMELRSKLTTACLAQHTMEKIAIHRLTDAPGAGAAEVVPNRVAYLIDQLKHPDEIMMLRTVYRRLFYLVGTTSYKARRKELLVESGIEADEADRLIERDRREDEDAGQQLEKGLKLADMYIRNRVGSDHFKAELARFFELVHGQKIHTPTRQEYGMYLAHAAGAKSACLSRQVGAAIISADGEIVSTGRNDVPKAGGGLYGFEPSSADMRCFLNGGYCRNVREKDLRRESIRQTVQTLRDDKKLHLENVSEADLKELVDAIYKQSGLGNLIEFSRSVHAEMDAIVSAARNGARSINGGTLFSTTFPCHSCARHVVAAGIVEVFYIEPYEKSLALKLHDDAIAFDEEEEDVDKLEPGKAKKVRFVHFEGVSPRAYIDMFQQLSERKDLAGVYHQGQDDAGKKIPEYLDSYKAFEARAVENFKRQFETVIGKPHQTTT